MKAVILAGGDGTRLKPIHPIAPKPMISVLGKPVLAYTIALLKRYGIEDILLTLHYRPEDILSVFGTGEAYGVRLQYRIESEKAGTAGAVLACRDFFGEEDFFVLPGDCLCDTNLGAMAEFHREKQAALTIALHESEEPLAYGTVLTDAEGRIRSFVEKPDWRRVVTDRVNTGIYLFSPRCLPETPRGACDFAGDLFPALLQRGERIFGYLAGGYWCDIGTPEAYYRCNSELLRGRAPAIYAPPEAEEKTAAPAEPPRGLRVFTKNRARLMRLLSETLMEAGADFTDGLQIAGALGAVRMYPDGDNECIVIENIQGAPPSLCREYGKLAKKLDENG